MVYKKHKPICKYGTHALWLSEKITKLNVIFAWVLFAIDLQTLNSLNTLEKASFKCQTSDRTY